jgi:DNA-binding LacI/PurR family transcriptional regulator
MRTKVINQRSIASKLNVSVATVSKALRGDTVVNEGTRKRVCAMAKTLGYKDENLYSKPLSRKNETDSRLILVLVNSSSYRASRSGYLEGLSRETITADMAMVTLFIDKEKSEEVVRPENQPWVMRQKGMIAGLVLVHRWPESVVAKLNRQWPVVSMMHEYTVANSDYVGVNNAHGVHVLIDKLHEKGHEKIGFFGLSPAVSWSRARYSGYMDAMCKHRLQVEPNAVVEVDPGYAESPDCPNWDTHYDDVAGLIKKGVKAWVCDSDMAGYEVYRGLTERGFRVPEDVAITGFDSADRFPHTDFRLTSVRVPAQDMGAGAVRLLISRSENPDIPRQVLKYDCDYVEGNTI